MKTLTSALLLSAIVLSSCGQQGSVRREGQPAVVATYVHVEYYIGCGTDPVNVDGTQYYPLPSSTQREPSPASAAGLGGGAGGPGALTMAWGAGRVVAPGPGDDVGTLTVYEDGFAFYESETGQKTWMTTTEQTYDWVC